MFSGNATALSKKSDHHLALMPKIPTETNAVDGTTTEERLSTMGKKLDEQSVQFNSELREVHQLLDELGYKIGKAGGPVE
ncbi:hypothetical protein K488DRAFT_82935 [Vararia minispora EC-137]|uniref:Uncharacterized protein n=1 Tax=Vararia minispora EC-137 TaxID=1314806 RepID=A0ACB8QUX7_9AGAM|nr:hypothetical protein K488DRAFT_82935 [Vararia minispora EC-137]